jgi:chromosome partitioning protein
MREAAATLDVPLAASAFVLRQIFADAPGQSEVVWNMGAKGRQAAKEVDAVFREVLPEALVTTQNVVAMNTAKKY